jgi:hypothetical protein
VKFQLVNRVFELSDDEEFNLRVMMDDDDIEELSDAVVDILKAFKDGDDCEVRILDELRFELVDEVLTVTNEYSDITMELSLDLVYEFYLEHIA